MIYFKHLLIVLLSLFLYAGCEMKQENAQNESALNMISGTSSKTWKTVREINEHGKRENLNKEGQSEVIQFYPDGHFIMKSGEVGNEGKWTYDKQRKNLSLTFQGANFTEYFSVLELDKNKMKITGRDGNTLVLKPGRG
jgi:hypothetical protein